MRRLSIVFFALGLASLSGCGGVKVIPCVAAPERDAVECNNQNGNAAREVAFALTENWACFSEPDLRTIYSTCGKSAALITVCVSDPASRGLQCNDKDGHASFVAYSATQGYTCFDEHDTRTIFETCAVKGRKATIFIQ